MIRAAAPGAPTRPDPIAGVFFLNLFHFDCGWSFAKFWLICGVFALIDGWRGQIGKTNIHLLPPICASYI